MGQFYARVFVQILDSSIAEDFMVRHVFEDMLKVCDMRGVVDMTRQAMARRFNVPLAELNRSIEKLEGPDEHSRDEDHEGRRIERLDAHRDWGWFILNWEKYEEIRNRADVAVRVARHRERKATVASNGSRKGLVLTNTSTGGQSVSLAVGAAAEVGKGIVLYPQGVWVMDEYTFTTGQIRAIGSTGSASLGVQEYT